MPRMGFSSGLKRSGVTLAETTLTRSKPTSKSTVSQAQGAISSEEIAQVAYELFERRGRREGFDQQDWFEAERIVRRRRQQPGNGR